MDHSKARAGKATLSIGSVQMRWAILALMILTGVLAYADRQLLAILKPLIGTDLHWTDSDYGFAASLFQLATAVSLLCGGFVIDRLSVSRGYVLCTGAWIASVVACAGAVTAAPFALCRVGVGISESMGTPIFVKGVAALFPPSLRALSFSLSVAAGSVSAAVAPLFLAPMGVALGWRGAMVAIAAMAATLLAVWWWLSARVDVALLAAPGRTTQSPIRNLLQDRRVWGVVGAKALTDQYWWFLLAWAPDLLHRHFDLDVRKEGAPLTLIFAAGAIGAFLCAWGAATLLRRGVPAGRVRKGTMLVGGLLTGLLLIAPLPLSLAAHQLWVAVFLLAVTVAGHQFFSISLFSAITEVLPQSRAGQVTAFGALCGNLAGSGIVYAAGRELSAGVGYAPLLVVMAVLYLVAIGWFNFWVPRYETAAAAAREGQ
jgi:MFS transporter, ACS family, hexuronate transporter